MAHYFTREEAESLLPQISIVLLQIQDHRKGMQQKEEELGALHAQAMGNGHHLHIRINKLQKELAEQVQTMQELIDFLSVRNGREVYLCWYLGEEHINFWHYPDAGFAGRQPL